MRRWWRAPFVVLIGAAVFGVVYSFSEFKAPSEILGGAAETTFALPTGWWWAVLAVSLANLILAGYLLIKTAPSPARHD